MTSMKYLLIILIAFLLSCKAQLPITQPEDKLTYTISPTIKANSSYEIDHEYRIEMDSIESYKSGFSVNHMQPIFNGDPIHTTIERKRLKLTSIDSINIPKSIRVEYLLYDKEINRSLYDSLSAVHYKSDSTYLDKKKKQHEKSMKDYQWLAVDTVFFHQMRNTDLIFDTILRPSFFERPDNERPPRMNKTRQKTCLPKFFLEPQGYPHGQMKVGETFILLDPENTLDGPPGIQQNEYLVDTTSVEFSEKLSNLCSADKHKYGITTYTLSRVKNNLAYFDIEYELHSLSMNHYYDIQQGKGFLEYDLDNNYYTNYLLKINSLSESNLLGFKMTKKSAKITSCKVMKKS